MPFVPWNRLHRVKYHVLLHPLLLPSPLVVLNNILKFFSKRMGCLSGYHLDLKVPFKSR